MLLASLSQAPAVAMLNNLFGPDTLIIFLIILIFFGAKKLPELARSMGQAMREFSRAKDDFEREISRPPVTAEPPQQIEAPAPASTAAVEPAPATHAQTDPHPQEVHPPVAVQKS